MVIGGSYLRAVVAWLKSQYPDHATAAWSSSGVIHAIQDFEDFDLDVYDSTMLSSSECTKRIRDVTKEIDDIWASGDPALKGYMFKKFNNNHPNIEHGDFM